MRKGYIICVDDHPAIVEALMTQLENAVGDTCEIEIAESAAEALDVINDLKKQGEQIDVVITDEIMPGMQGSQFLEVIHTIDPGIMKVMLTGQAGFDDVVYAINKGELDWCIKKPWSYEELKSTILQLLEKSRIRRRNQRLAEEVIAEKNKAEAIVHSITDGIIVFDGDDRISLVNAACTTILGRSESELIGQRILDALELQEFVTLLVEASQRSDEVISDEILLQWDGEEPQDVYIIAIAKTLRDKEEKPLGVVMVLRDITREKELNRMKANFLSTVSHELRTPLTSILSTYELLLQDSLGELNPDQREFISMSKEQGDVLSELIDNLIDITSLEANQMDLSQTSLNIQELAHDVVEDYSEAAVARGLACTSDIDDTLPPILADERKMNRLLKNLLSNAIKFTEQGSIHLSIHQTDDDHIHIAVADTGVGVSEEYFDRIFEKFFQVDDSVTREFSGSGLGLPICRAIVQAHQGEIWLESTVGEGTTFHVKLPLRPTGEPDTA